MNAFVLYSARLHSVCTCIWIWKPSVLLKIVSTQTCKAGLFFAWSTCTFFWLVIFLRVLYLLLMFKRYESAGVLCCDAFSLFIFISWWFSFTKKWLLYIHYIILVGELKFDIGVAYGSTVWCSIYWPKTTIFKAILLVYFLNKLILYYPFNDVVINNEMIQIYSIKVKVGCNHCRLAEKKKSCITVYVDFTSLH